MYHFSNMNLRTKYFHLNSGNKAGGNTASFTTDLGSTNTERSTVRAINVVAISFPHLFYNIDTHNNTLVVRLPNGVGTIDRTLTFPVGYYSLGTFLNQLNTFLTNPIGHDAVTITAPTDLNTAIEEPTKVISFTTDLAIQFLFAGSTMAELLGLTQDTLSSTTTTLQEIPHFNNPDEIFIYSSLTNSTAIGDHRSHINYMDVIPLGNVPFGEYVHYTPKHPDIGRIDFRSGRLLSDITIDLRDKNKRLLSLPPNHQVSATVRYEYYE